MKKESAKAWGMRQMRRSLFALILSMILCVAAGHGIAQGGETDEPAAKKATVMIYLCGADLELKNGQGTKAMGEIGKIGFDTDQISVIALAGGTINWMKGYDTSRLTLLEVGGRHPAEAGTMELSSMGKGETLTTFLNYCHAQYPAEKYELILWDHGGGPNRGICFDMLFEDDSLSVNELADAIGQSVFAQKGIDIIAFNTCLTGSVEYACNLAPFAKYMVATEDSMYGLSYEWIGTLANDPTPLDTVQKIVDGTYRLNQERYTANQDSLINSVAAVDLDKISAVKEAMDAFFKELDRQIKISLDICNIHDIYDGLRLFLKYKISRNEFFARVRRHRINAGKVCNQGIVVTFDDTVFTVHGYAGKIADVLVGTRKLVKECGLSAVLVADQRKG